jgi:very-short-patch-repair endonuclease
MTDYELAEFVIKYSDSDEEKDAEPDLTQYTYINDSRLCFTYYIGYEIAALCGYKNPKSTVTKIVSKCNQLHFRDYPGIKEPVLDPRTILVSTGGACEILLKTRKTISPDVIHLLKKFGIETTNRKCLTKEQQTLSAISIAFKTENMEDQYKVGKYYIDLYFPDYRLCIECDEDGHSSRRPSDERERMDFVNKELGIDDSYWIRFNPDEKDFDVIKVIGQINLYLKITGKYVPKYVTPVRAKKNINLNLEKPCNMCKIVKSLEEFNPASDHRDGRENVCTICRRKRQYEILTEKKEVLGEVSQVTCNICKETLPLKDFYKDKNSPTGVMRRCKVCHKGQNKNIEKKDKILITEKRCKTCEKTKPVIEFHKRMCSRDGYNIYCKSCACDKSKILAKKNK